MLMNAQQQLEITVMLMQTVRIQLDHLHVLVLLDLMGMVLIVQVSLIHGTKHVFTIILVYCQYTDINAKVIISSS